MSSVFAVQVWAGSEIEVKDTLSRLLKKIGDTTVKAIHAYETITQKGRSFKERGKLEGYILIELNDIKLSNNLWHLIKNVPKVIQILKNQVSEEEFHQLTNIDLESTLDVTVDRAKTEEEIANEQRELLHKANMEKDIKKQEEYIRKMDELDNTPANQLKKLKDEAVGVIKAQIDKCKAFIKEKKERFIFPFSLFLKVKETLPDTPYEKLVNGNIIVPIILNKLREEIRRNE